MRISAEEYKRLLKKVDHNSKCANRHSKYNARKVRVDGILFDSQKEADYYCELKLLLKAGKITGFCRQARFMVTAGDETTKATEYVTDFIAFYPDGTYRIIDVKGMKTELFKLKMKSFREKYPNIKVEMEK